MKYFSTFSGIGGFEIAIQKIVPSAKCIGYSEILSSAIKVYEKKFPKHKNYGDITKIEKVHTKFDLLVGGTPCQDFTILGSRKGLSGTKSRLFYDFIRILKKAKPKNFIFENVKGSLSSNSGWDFANMQIEFWNAGYDTEWQVLNSKNFGLAQNRERVYIVGHFGEKSKKRVFPITTSSESSQRKIKEVNGGFHRYRTYSPKGISPCLTSYQFAGYARTKIEFEKEVIRELTPKEYERIQGFPDNWTDCVDKLSRYQLLGNAVSPKVIEQIIKKL